MSNGETQNENPGMKAISDFFVDIFGGLIPGVLFLFSVIMGIIGPLVYIFFQVEDISTLESGIHKEPHSILSSLFNGLFQGWFWIVIFLTFLILAYVVGHIFYRSDIKDVDKLAFIPLRNADIYKIFVDFQNYICFKHNEKYNNRIWRGRIKGHKILMKVRERVERMDVLRCIKKNIKRTWKLQTEPQRTQSADDEGTTENKDSSDHTKKEEKKKKEKEENEKNISIAIKKYFCRKLADLIRLIVWDGEKIKPDEKTFTRLFQDDNGKLFPVLQDMVNAKNDDYLFNILFQNKKEKEAPDKINIEWTKKYFETISALNKIVFPNLAFPDFLNTGELERTDGHNCGTEKNDKDLFIRVMNYNLDAMALDVIARYRKIIEKYFTLTKLEYKIDVKEDETFVRIVVLYCILSVQSEEACESKETCNFPYSSYFKYLLKRDEGELAGLARWYNENTRSKNMLNNYKTFIQLTAPKSYQIMTKIESHIRMASSSYYAAKVLKTWLWLGVLIIIIAFFISNSGGSIKYMIAEINSTDWWNNKIHLEQLIIILCPLFNLLLLRYLKKSILKFIHYQRLKEIFTSLVVYKYVLGQKETANNGQYCTVTPGNKEKT